MSPSTDNKPRLCDLPIDQRIDALFALFEKHGEMNYVGENVSQIQHAQQVCTFPFSKKILRHDKIPLGLLKL